MTMMTVDQVIERAGGSRRIADALLIGTGAVRQWRMLKFVPDRRVLDLSELAGVDPKQIPRKPRPAVRVADDADPSIIAAE